MRQDLQLEIKSKEEVKHELWTNIELRKKSEDELNALANEVSIYKQQFDNRRQQEVHDMQHLSTLNKDLKHQNEDLHQRLAAKSDESRQMQEEMFYWKETGERLQGEVGDLKRIVEDMEDKNRKLIEKLNEQIYMKATEYKEKTLQALQRSDSPTKLRRAIGFTSSVGPGANSDLRLS